MAGTMEWSLLFVIILHISTVSGVIEISFEKGVPRLNNSLYCDYYFACHTEGETLQWRVGNNVFNYSGQSTIGSVFDGSVSNCKYTATLLSLKPLSLSRSFKSALILTCQSNFNMSINCSDGSLLEKMISIPEKESSLVAETTNNLIYLEHVLFQNLVNADISTCTNVFVCGVNNSFMNVQLGNAMFLFTELDSIGRERNAVQDTSVQQAILIDKEPYSLVVAMFIVGDEVMNVTCDFSQNSLSLSSKQCHPVTTMPMPETTGTMESESSTEGESSTMASGDSSTLPLILGLIMAFGALVTIIIIVIVFGYFIVIRNRKRIQHEQEELERERAERERIERERAERERIFSQQTEKEEPLKKLSLDQADSGIPLEDKIKEKIAGVDYESFCRQVQYILLTRNQYTFYAATTYVKAPDVEEKTLKVPTTKLTRIVDNDNVYIGMVGSHPVCLVNETGDNFIEKLEEVISQHVHYTKFIIYVKGCLGTDDNAANLADILISKLVAHAVRNKKLYNVYDRVVAPEIRTKFCFYPNEFNGIEVTKGGRRAQHLVADIASGENRFAVDERYKDYFLSYTDDIKGYEEVSGKLLHHFEDGIIINGSTQKIQVIIVGAVTGYINSDSHDDDDDKWLLIASEAAFYYITSKMCQNTSDSISYEIKDPENSATFDWQEFGKEVQFMIITLHKDEFDAATTNISGPDDTHDNIIKITDTTYIGKVGVHKVGLLYFDIEYHDNILDAIIFQFPNAKYLVRVGACNYTNNSEVNLGDVLISKEISVINKNDNFYSETIAPISTEIEEIFGSPQCIDGIQLPGNKNAKHKEVRIASGTNIEIDQRMKRKAISSSENFGFEELGGILVSLKNMMNDVERKIHVIVIAGASRYGESTDGLWDFIASQAAFNYVTKKMKLHSSDEFMTHTPQMDVDEQGGGAAYLPSSRRSSQQSDSTSDESMTQAIPVAVSPRRYRRSSQQSDSTSDESMTQAIPVVKNPFDDTAPPI